MACPTVSGRTGISERGRGLLSALLVLIFVLAAWVPFSTASAFADTSDAEAESQTWAVCGNFAFTLPQGATCETLDSTEVDSALQASEPINGAIDQDGLCRIDTADGMSMYVYACRALIDAGDVAWANTTTDEVALQERGKWFVDQFADGDSLLTSTV